MHTFFTPFGIYPNNAIVGGSGSIAVGAALYKKVNRKPGIVVANLGDASMARGPVWEGMTFAAMDQFKQLWSDEMKGGLPVIINIMDNQYGMGGQTRGETMGFDFAARIGAGVNPAQMHAERVDGYNPLAVIDCYRRKKAILEKEKDGPVLIDVLTYRYSGHSPSDASSYRTKEEIEAWEAQDCIVAFGKELIAAGVATQADLDAMTKEIKDIMFETFKLAIDDELSPRMDLHKEPELLGTMMFSNQSIDSLSDAKPDVNHPMSENPRVQQIAKKERFAFDKDGKPFSKMKQFQLRDGIFEAIIDRFYKDASLIAYGEENRDWGGAFAVYRGLTEALPYHRLFNAPIAEAAIIGTGDRLRHVRRPRDSRDHVLRLPRLLRRRGVQPAAQVAGHVSGNILKMPVVVRVFGRIASTALSTRRTGPRSAAHIPGLKVVFPVTPYDAKGLMNAALQGTDPVIFFESQRIYDVGEQFHEGGVPEGYYEIPLGEPDIKREGKDITILTIGATLYRALEGGQSARGEVRHGAPR